MKRINITKLSLTPRAAQQLRRLGLSRSDLAIVLRFGRRIRRSRMTFYIFGRKQIPTGCERRLRRLVGATVAVRQNRIIAVCRNRRAGSRTKKKREWGSGRVGEEKDEWENGRVGDTFSIFHFPFVIDSDRSRREMTNIKCHIAVCNCARPGSARFQRAPATLRPFERLSVTPAGKMPALPGRIHLETAIRYMENASPIDPFCPGGEKDHD